MSGGRIALIITGSILALVSLGLLAGGGGLVWAPTTQRDDDGYYSTRSERFQTDGYAIRTDDLDIGTEGPDWLFDEGRLGTIRVTGAARLRWTARGGLLGRPLDTRAPRALAAHRPSHPGDDPAPRPRL